MDGLRYRDRASDFQRRLDSFPKTLEGFFQRMLDTTEPMYKQQTARTFKVALTAEEPLDLILYSFMDEIEDDPSWALNCSAVECSKDEILEVHEAMRPRLDPRCKGLLEIQKQSYLQGPADISFKQYNAEFLYRTARDFLINSLEVSAMFERELGDDFDPLVVLGGSLLASMKKARMDPPEWKSQQHLLETANQLIVYATRVLQPGHDTSAKNKSEWFAILTNLHATISNRSTHLSSVRGIEELFEIAPLDQFCQDQA
ncbi:hypothetical protein INS49_014790 [Diaporthe citri]|uniref:uncharacterized protein n=1 Tax=Diaporthe citri TaxID=83186 RepID=UPI001C7E2625|nr:uncharacterized protein INS49_014790 [Diaporthe citri]KAG6356915.1 hypothetical protein INS49_014790 [Diaporthe citri]